MKLKYFRFISILILAALVGCSGLPFSLGNTPQAIQNGTVVPTPGLVFDATQTAVPTALEGTQEAETGSSGSILRIWVPPEFDPQGDSPASSLLKARLDAFAAENPDTKLEVRVKTLEGAGGMLDSLVSANVAAPLVLPDLVLLPRPLLESATLKGLLYPYDGLTSIMDDADWFDYARQLAQVQSGTYGLPFAGDAMLLAYHPSLRETAPIDLEAAAKLGEVMLFPATDPQALFTLNTYLAEGGSLQDEQGRPTLDEATLTRVLEYDQRASQAGVMPYWLTQYSTDGQVWDAFMNTPYPMAVTWVSSILSDQLTGSGDLAAAPIPTLNGKPYTLATGWSWALAGQDPERKAQAVKLAEYLVDKEFMSEWTQAAGYLPPRADSLQNWQDAAQRDIFQQISTSARLMPSIDLISSIGPAVEQAVVDVLKAQSDPQTAAQTAINQINKP
jgi:multiple sugar transport system substrate-binding protein